MKICFYCPALVSVISGGIENYLLYVAREVKRRGHEVDIVSGLASRKADAGLLRIEGARVHLLPFFPRTGLANKALLRILRNCGHDLTPYAVESFTMLPFGIAYFLGNSYDLVTTGGLGDIFVKYSLRRTPLVVHYQGGHLNWYFEALRRDRRLGQVHLITCSRGVAESLRRLKLPCEISYVYNGVDVSKFAPSKQMRDKAREYFGLGEKRVLLYVGRFVEYKGVEYLIQALKATIQAYPDTTLLLVGSGGLEKSYIDLARRIGVESKLRILLDVPHSQLPLVYNSADVFVLPLLSGVCTSSALAEAQACGLPAVATDVPSEPEVLIDGENGFLVPPRSPQALASRVIQLLGDEDLRRDMGTSGRERVIRYQSWNVVVRQILDRYKQIIEDASRR